MKIVPFITFIVGALAGAAASYVFTCNHYKKEINTLTEWYTDEIDKCKESLDKAFEQQDIPEDVQVVEDDSEPEIFSRPVANTNVVDYSKIRQTKIINDQTTPQPDKLSNLENFMDIYNNYVANFHLPPEVSADYPQLISDVEASGLVGYENVGINYYPKERLCFYEDNDEPILDIDDECSTLDQLIGVLNLETFDKIDVDVIYVRNDETEQLFEICKCIGDSPIAKFRGRE